MASTAREQPIKQVDPQIKELAWYKEDVTAISEPARHLLETYSGIPADEVVPHVLAIVRYRSIFLSADFPSSSLFVPNTTSPLPVFPLSALSLSH